MKKYVPYVIIVVLLIVIGVGTTYIIMENKNNNNNNGQESQNSSTESKTEKEKIEDMLTLFVKAINEKNWAEAKKYTTNDVIDNVLKKYNVSNVSLKNNTMQKNVHADNYYLFISYNVDYNGLTNKDLNLGNIIVVEKSNNSYIVSNFGVTGL